MIGLFLCVLAWVSILSKVIGIVALAPFLRWIALGSLTLILALPIEGLPLVAYFRAYHGDFSVTTMLLLLSTLCYQMSGRLCSDRDQLLPIFLLLFMTSLVLYPTALGATNFSLYTLGHDTKLMLSVLAPICLVCWYFGYYHCVIIFVSAILAHRFGMIESTNMWDYLIDPFVSIYSFISLIICLRLRRMAIS